jgi:hypothetical protein
MRPPRFLYLLTLLLLVCYGSLSCEPARGSKSGPDPLEQNRLSTAEQDEGWILLFDGTTFDGWRGIGRPDVPEGHWVIDNGTIKKVASGEVPVQADGQPLQGGDIMTERTFRNFELFLEWRISPGGNSGIKYNVSEEMSMTTPPRTAAIGFEYQILDDTSHPDAENGENRTAGALYDLIPPAGKLLKPVGGYNTARIIFNNGHGEHWLNSTKVLEYNLDSDRFRMFLRRSKYRGIPGFADIRDGHIVLQDHTDTVWYRNIKIRELGP